MHLPCEARVTASRSRRGRALPGEVQVANVQREDLGVTKNEVVALDRVEPFLVDDGVFLTRAAPGYLVVREWTTGRGSEHKPVQLALFVEEIFDQDPRIQIRGAPQAHDRTDRHAVRRRCAIVARKQVIPGGIEAKKVRKRRASAIETPAGHGISRPKAREDRERVKRSEENSRVPGIGRDRANGAIEVGRLVAGDEGQQRVEIDSITGDKGRSPNPREVEDQRSEECVDRGLTERLDVEDDFFRTLEIGAEEKAREQQQKYQERRECDVHGALQRSLRQPCAAHFGRPSATGDRVRRFFLPSTVMSTESVASPPEPTVSTRRTLSLFAASCSTYNSP